MRHALQVLTVASLALWARSADASCVVAPDSPGPFGIILAVAPAMGGIVGNAPYAAVGLRPEPIWTYVGYGTAAWSGLLGTWWLLVAACGGDNALPLSLATLVLAGADAVLAHYAKDLPFAHDAVSFVPFVSEPGSRGRVVPGLTLRFR